MKRILILSVVLSFFLVAPSYAKLDLPTNYVLHTLDKSYVPQKDFHLYRDNFWIRPEQKEMVFQLNPGDVNTYDEHGVRTEAFTPKEWKARNAKDWHTWKGSYRVDAVGGGSCLFQQKSRDIDVQWEVQINVNAAGDVILNHRRLKDVVLAKDRKGKSFHIKVSSNGRRYKVWYNGRLYADVKHQMDPSGRSSYQWRWGIYKRESNYRQTVTMYNIKYD